MIGMSNPGKTVTAIVTIILHSGKLFVKTVEWEDT